MTWLDSVYLRYTTWIRSVADRPAGFIALFVIAFAEASLLPISVDIPLIALGLARRPAAIIFGVVAVAGSFLGGYAGYAIGSFLFHEFGSSLIGSLGFGEKLPQILAAFADRGVWVLISAGFTPLPYVLFTIAAGWSQSFDPWTLAIGMLTGRVLRFLPVAVLVSLLGDRAVALVDRYRLIFLIIGTLVVAAMAGGIVWYSL
jgi:membrane protein YqaA with SNARE-associated domain